MLSLWVEASSKRDSHLVVALSSFWQGHRTDAAARAAKHSFSQVGRLPGMGGLRLECPVGDTAVCVLCYPSSNMEEIPSGGHIPSVGLVRAARGQISSVASAESAKSAGKVCAGHGAVKTVVVEHGDVLSIEVDVPKPGLCGGLLCF